MRAVARGRRGFPGEVRQCSGKRCEVSMRPFPRTSKQGIDGPLTYYTGLTSDVARRCAEHNAVSCTHTDVHETLRHTSEAWTVVC